MAVAHYQFEAIHPFFDGNGRTGRIINILLLVQYGLLKYPVLYLSRNILANKDSYYSLLNAVTAEDAWEPWVQFMLNAVREASTWTLDRIHEIRDLQDEIAAELKRNLPAIYSHELVTVIFEQPYCRIDNVVETANVTRQTASKWLRALTESGILNETAVGRNHVFINHRLYEILTRP